MESGCRPTFYKRFMIIFHCSTVLSWALHLGANTCLNCFISLLCSTRLIHTYLWMVGFLHKEIQRYDYGVEEVSHLERKGHLRRGDQRDNLFSFWSNLRRYDVVIRHGLPLQHCASFDKCSHSSSSDTKTRCARCLFDLVGSIHALSIWVLLHVRAHWAMLGAHRVLS